MKKINNRQQSIYLNTETAKTCVVFLQAFLPLLIIACSFKRSEPLIYYSLLAFAGWLSWTFIEYFNHRFRMHGNSNTSNVIGYQRHILHHHHPTDIKITPAQRFFLFIVNLALITLCVVFKNWVLLFTGFYTGFVIYTLMHWFLHRKLSAKVFPEVHEFHIHHHCKHPDKCFGVTVTWWDHMFDTIPHKQRDITDRIKKFYYKQ